MKRRPCNAELARMADEDARAQRMIDTWPWCHWYDEQPWWFRAFLSTFAASDYDLNGNWYAFCGRRYYWRAEPS